MENNYKRTIAGSVGAGVDALMNASGRKFYILEHKTESKFHHVGESQKIIVDQVELGRDSSCQVRFDDSMETVSRRHAAIVRDGDNYKLIPMSQTNATLVNGQAITGEWHLNSGDEIRLSSRGPVLGFIIPQGKAALTNSISITERMSLFRQQALRPYKFAITFITVFLLAAIAGLAYWSYTNNKAWEEKDAVWEEREQARVNAEKEAADKAANYFAELENCYNAVYYVRMDNIVVYSANKEEICSFNTSDIVGGTGFLLEDGRFVTAHRVIEPWFYQSNVIGTKDGIVWTFGDVQALSNFGCTVVANYTAYSPSGASFKFMNSEMTISQPSVSVESASYKIRSNSVLTEIVGKKSVELKYYNNSHISDWAYLAKTDQLAVVNGLISDSEASLDPKVQEEVKILGYPMMKGYIDSRTIEPVVFTNNVNVTGLNDEGIIELSSSRFQMGNNGGPVLMNKGGLWKVVGVLCETDKSDRDVVVPIGYVK